MRVSIKERTILEQCHNFSYSYDPTERCYEVRKWRAIYSYDLCHELPLKSAVKGANIAFDSRQTDCKSFTL